MSWAVSLEHFWLNMYLAVADGDLQIRRAGGGGGGGRALRAPPLDPPMPRSNLPVSFSVSIILKQT